MFDMGGRPIADIDRLEQPQAPAATGTTRHHIGLAYALVTTALWGV